MRCSSRVFTKHSNETQNSLRVYWEARATAKTPWRDPDNVLQTIARNHSNSRLTKFLFSAKCCDPCTAPWLQFCCLGIGNIRQNQSERGTRISNGRNQTTDPAVSFGALAPRETAERARRYSVADQRNSGFD